MKITYLEHSEINKPKWDECIDNSINRIVYAQSWYLDIVNKNWDALVAGNYEIIMPLTHGNKYGMKYLYQPFFTQQLGIFSKKELSKNIVEEFLVSIPAKFRFVDIVLNKANNFKLEDFETTKNANYELKLNKPYAEIASEYATNTKRNLKKTEQNNLSVAENVNTEELINLFRNNLGKTIKNIKTPHYNLLKQIMDKALAEQDAKIYGINSNSGKLNAGAFFLKSYNSFIFLFSATNQESKESGAMFKIIDQFINEYADADIILDFEGSNIESLARFYKGFGADKFHYLRIKRNNLPALLRIFKR